MTLLSYNSQKVAKNKSNNIELNSFFITTFLLVFTMYRGWKVEGFKKYVFMLYLLATILSGSSGAKKKVRQINY